MTLAYLGSSTPRSQRIYGLFGDFPHQVGNWCRAGAMGSILVDRLVPDMRNWGLAVAYLALLSTPRLIWASIRASVAA